MHDLFAVAYFVINNVISGKTSLGSGGSRLEQVSAVCRFQFSVGQNLVIVMIIHRCHHHHSSSSVISLHRIILLAALIEQSPAVITRPTKYTLHFCTGVVMSMWILPRFLADVGMNSSQSTAWMRGLQQAEIPR